MQIDSSGIGVVRSWSARATKEGAQAYVEFFRQTLTPQLGRIPGHRGALVLQRSTGHEVEITVLTFWESMDAVKRFAGDPPDMAVIEPDARAFLLSFDESVRHLSVSINTVASNRRG